MKLVLPLKKKKSFAGTRRKKTQVFADKMVDSRKEPTLFNICSAQMSMMASTGPYTNVSQMRGTTPKENRRNIIAKDVLQMMNVGLSELPPNYSLLMSNSEKTALQNPYMVDMVDFQLTVNNVVPATDKFVSPEDPFYQLDDGINSAASYKVTKKSGTGEIASDPDLSCIASNMTILNQNVDVFGKNKYF